jgi:GGDEF domain-containing protein
MTSGALYLIQVANFKEFNAELGFKSGDALLRQLGAVLSNIEPCDGVVRSRITGATFALAVFNLTRDRALQLGNAISEKIGLVLNDASVGFEMRYGCGGAFYEKEVQSLGNLMSVADMAMLQSTTGGQGLAVLLDCKTESDDELGSQHWKRMILDALGANRIALLSQPVMSFDGDHQLQYEVVGRLIDEDGELVAAADFCRWRFHCRSRQVVGKGIRVLEKGPVHRQVAINLFIRTGR